MDVLHANRMTLYTQFLDIARVRSPSMETCNIDVGVAPACATVQCAQKPVVVRIDPEVGIERANPVEEALARKGPLMIQVKKHEVAGVNMIEAPGDRTAVRAVVHDIAPYQIDVRVGREDLPHALQHIRVVQAVVSIQEIQHLTCRPRDSLVHRVVNPLIRLARNREREIVETMHHIQRAIGGSAIHHHVLEIAAGLLARRLKRVRDAALGVEAHCDEGKEWLIQI